ncbi:hypothetical protein GcM1_167002 [Golovinomyces cichoracearum]|uniref:2EXR domain-containing protein n=1 Tax=Golovinomyces cichoracearum TaxID=62708 RepID=A0A420J7L9_9PEZI|nr:hypothetical protein GcM1_167002 [Golovinomyces cichoracearum]
MKKTMSDVTPMTFHHFRLLAPELRLKIFNYAMPQPYVIPLSVLYTGGGVNFYTYYDDGHDEHEEDTHDDSGYDENVKEKENNQKNIGADARNSRFFLPLITKAYARGLSHTCREFRNVFLNAFPNKLVLSNEKGVIWLNYRTTIIYLRQFQKLVDQPAISHFLFNGTSNSNGHNARSGHHSDALQFPTFFSHITQLALPIDCITEYPEASAHPFTLYHYSNEGALFAKMIEPFTALRYLWAVADDIYWQLDITLTLNGYFQPYPYRADVSVLGFLAERKEQLAIWAEYRNVIIRCRAILSTVESHQAENSISSRVPTPIRVDTYYPPALMIWGMEEIELWDFLCEFKTSQT